MKKLIMVLSLLTTAATGYASAPYANQYSIFPGHEIAARPVLMLIDRIDENAKGILQITEARSGSGGNYIQGNSLQEYTVIREKSKDERFGYHIATYRVIDVNFVNSERQNLMALRIGDYIEFNSGISSGWEQGLFKLGPNKMRYVISRSGSSSIVPQVRLCRAHF